MKSIGMHGIKIKKQRVAISEEGKTSSPTKKRSNPPLSPCEDLHVLIAKRAYELYNERGYRHGYALDDWLEAEREVISQIPPA